MAKAGELRYFRELPEVALRQAIEKPWGHPERAKLLANLAGVMSMLPEPPARVLDMGCGTGWTSIALARSGWTVHGVDLSPDAVAIATDLARGLSASFAVGDFEAPQHEAFDAVLFFDCLHHAESPKAAVSAAFKALREGGRLITVEPGLGHHKAPESIAAMEKYGVTERSMPSLRVRKLAKQAGFRTFETYPIPRVMVASSPLRAVYHALAGRWLQSAITVCHK